jgi:anti-sigma factor RsiW
MDYLEGTLAADQRDTLEQHVRLCPDCQRYIDGYKKSIQMSREALLAPDPAEIPEQLVQAILKARASGQ